MIVIGEFDDNVAVKWGQWTTISEKRDIKGSKIFVKRNFFLFSSNFFLKESR